MRVVEVEGEREREKSEVEAKSRMNGKVEGLRRVWYWWVCSACGSLMPVLSVCPAGCLWCSCFGSQRGAVYYGGVQTFCCAFFSFLHALASLLGVLLLADG